MMKNTITILIFVIMISAAGCGQKQQIDAKFVKVTYVSNPPGGTLYKQNGELWGKCPKVLLYELDNEAIKKGYLNAKGLLVKWPSGLERKSGDTIRIKVNGTDRRVTFKQPRGPVAAIDAETLHTPKDL